MPHKFVQPPPSPLIALKNRLPLPNIFYESIKCMAVAGLLALMVYAPAVKETTSFRVLAVLPHTSRGTHPGLKDVDGVRGEYRDTARFFNRL